MFCFYESGLTNFQGFTESSCQTLYAILQSPSYCITKSARQYEALILMPVHPYPLKGESPEYWALKAVNQTLK